MGPPEFDITALMLGDAKAERDSERARAFVRGEVEESRGFLKAAISAAEQADRDRTVGSAIGSGVSNFATGYALSPLLKRIYAGKGEGAVSLKALREAPRKHLKEIYGPKALATGAVLSGAALLGGAIREGVQTHYERSARRRRREAKKEAGDSMATTSGSSGALNRVTGSITKPKTEYDRLVERVMERRRSKTAALGIMTYARDPGEAPKAERPKPAKGRAATMFGGRVDPQKAVYKRTERKGEEWHQANAEFVELGDRPGLSDALSEIMGLEPGTVLSRRDVSALLREKDQTREKTFKYRRAAKEQKRNATHVPGDTRELVDALKMLLENPEARFFEVVET